MKNRQLLLTLTLVLSGHLIAKESLPTSSTRRTYEDVTSTTQSSVMTKSCIVVNKTRERLCDKRAEEWCNKNKGARECRHFMNADVSK